MIDYNAAAGVLGTQDTHSNRSLSAFFDTTDDAQDAMDRLRDAGIADSNVRMTQGNSTAISHDAEPAQSRGFFDSLGDFFFPEDDRHVYAEGLNRGGHLVTVTGLSDTMYDVALDILDDEGAVDMDERSETWRSEGWSGGSDATMGDLDTTRGSTSANPLGGVTSAIAGAVGMGSTSMDSDRTTPRMGASALDDGEETIEVMEERLRVGKRDASNGRVRVRAYVVEEPVSETVSLREDRVDIQRRPVDRSVAVGDTAFADRTIEAEEFREEVVVSKEARIVEEIGIRKTSGERSETVTDTVRRTEVEIEDDRDVTPTTQR